MSVAKSQSGPAKLLSSVRRIFQDPNPLLIKELRTVLRTPLFIRFLYLATGALALVTLMFGATTAASSMVPAEVGRLVFQLFFSLAFFVIVTVGPAYAATTLTSEHEGRTYESLILTGMDPWRIVRGKFIACMGGMSLVLISFAPIVGIAFLFGGVSPLAVLFGFCGLFLVMAPAVASGVAISSRRRKTRMAILLAVAGSGVVSLPAFGLFWALGEDLGRTWALNMEGPLWFTEALANRFFEFDTFLLLVALPVYVSGVMVWFLLASAVAGVRPGAEDRSGPFKLWAVVAIVGYVLLSFALPWAPSTTRLGEVTVLLGMVALPFVGLLALTFANEPPLPPRQYLLDRETFPAFRIPFTIFGPGASGTTRFGIVAIVVAVFGSSAALIAARHLSEPAMAHNRFDLAIGVAALGHTAIGAFTLTLTQWIRLLTRHPIASRVVATAVMMSAYVAPVLLSLLFDENALDDLDSHVPLLFQISPVYPDVVAFRLLENSSTLWLTKAWTALYMVVVFGGLSVVLWLLIELRVRRTMKRVVAQRVERDRRSRESMPPGFRASIQDAPTEEPALASPLSDQTP